MSSDPLRSLTHRAAATSHTDSPGCDRKHFTTPNGYTIQLAVIHSVGTFIVRSLNCMRPLSLEGEMHLAREELKLSTLEVKCPYCKKPLTRPYQYPAVHVP